MSSTVILEDEFGQIYTYHESKFNLNFPMRKIGLPGSSTITFSNGLIGENGLTDQIINEDPDILDLTYSEVIDRIKLSNIKSIEVNFQDTPKKWFQKVLVTDPSYMTWVDWLVIIGILLALICIFVISIL
jgi:hypothetical protein